MPEKKENIPEKISLIRRIYRKTPLWRIIKTLSDRIDAVESFASQQSVRIHEYMASHDQTTNAISLKLDSVGNISDSSDRRLLQIEERMAGDDQTTSVLMDNIRGLNEDVGSLKEQVHNMNLIGKWAGRQAVSASETSAVQPWLPVEDSVDILFYHDFEECFRGTQNQIRSRLEDYLPTLKSHFGDFTDKSFVDVGCGRGEWLDLLRNHGAKNSVGIDMNEVQVEIGKDKGHKVLIGDCIKYISSLEDESLDVVTGFQIIEHLPLPALLSLFGQCYRALKLNGMVIFETPNSGNLITAASNFYLDPTHQRPIHKDLARFLLLRSGFSDVRFIESTPMEESQWLKLPDGGENYDIWIENLNKLNALLYGPQDYAVIGIKQGRA